MISSDRTLAAAGLILVYAMVIGFTDNYVQVIAENAGLWQFHFTRTVMAMALLIPVAMVMGLRLRPVRLRAVVARSAIHGCAMVIYFGALADKDSLVALVMSLRRGSTLVAFAGGILLFKEDAGVALRPFLKWPRLEFRLGTTVVVDAQNADTDTSLYGMVRFVY